MQRRTFLKYSALTGTTMLFPRLVEANWFAKSVKTALYCSKLNPVRFFSGLIFDEVAEVYVVPLLKKVYNDFVNGHNFFKSDLTYYSSLSSVSSGHFEEYKASTVIYGIADYEKYKESQQAKLKLLLTRDADIKRFKLIQQYLRDEKAELKLYNLPTYFKVGSDLEPNELFNVKHLVFNNHKKRHHEELLKITNNSVFGELII